MAFSGGLEGSERETAFRKQWTTQESEFSMQNRFALINRNLYVNSKGQKLLIIAFSASSFT